MVELREHPQELEGAPQTYQVLEYYGISIAGPTQQSDESADKNNPLLQYGNSDWLATYHTMAIPW
jgi:hypothetical protein